MQQSPMAYSNLPEVSSNDAPQLAPVGHGDNKMPPEVVPQTVADLNRQDYPETLCSQQYGTTSPYSTSPAPQPSVMYYPPPPALGPPPPPPSQIYPAEEQRKGTLVIKKRTCIILAVVLALVVTGAIVGGVLGGVLAARRGGEAQNNTTGGGGKGNNQGGSNNGTEGGGNNGGGGSPNNGSGPPNKANPNAIVMQQSFISAVSYTVNGTDHRLVFWQPQSSVGDIKCSAWDSKDGKWEVFDLKTRLQGSTEIGAKPGTAIAAAVRPGDANNGGGEFTLSVVYANPSGGLEELRSTDVKGRSWEKLSYKIFAATRSQLAARWDVCRNRKCLNTLLVAYETDSQLVRIHYPHETSINHQSVDHDITPGSGIALTALSHNLITNEADSGKLYFQSARRLQETTRELDFSWRDPRIADLPSNLPAKDPPLIYATSFEKANGGFKNVAIIQRYREDGHLTMTHWNDRRWSSDVEITAQNVPSGVSLSRMTSAVSLSMDMKAYIVPENCESIHIYDVSKENPAVWNHAGEVTIKQ